MGRSDNNHIGQCFACRAAAAAGRMAGTA